MHGSANNNYCGSEETCVAIDRYVERIRSLSKRYERMVRGQDHAEAEKCGVKKAALLRQLGSYLGDITADLESGCIDGEDNEKRIVSKLAETAVIIENIRQSDIRLSEQMSERMNTLKSRINSLKKGRDTVKAYKINSGNKYKYLNREV